MQGSAEIVGRVGESLSLGYNAVGGLEQALELVLQGIEVDFTVVEPLA